MSKCREESRSILCLKKYCRVMHLHTKMIYFHPDKVKRMPAIPGPSALRIRCQLDLGLGVPVLVLVGEAQIELCSYSYCAVLYCRHKTNTTIQRSSKKKVLHHPGIEPRARRCWSHTDVATSDFTTKPMVL